MMPFTGYRLNGALCLYDRHGAETELRPYPASPGSYAEFHPVQQGKDGKSSLGPGRALTSGQIKALFAGLFDEENKQLRLGGSPGLIPPGLLGWWRGGEVAAWFEPALVRPLFHLKKNWPAVPHPGLIFLTCNGSLQVFAVKEAGRPGLDTRLFAAPYWNLSGDGRLCLGNCGGLGEGPAPDRIKRIRQIFFNSYFSHDRGTAYGKIPLDALWDGLAGKTKFPPRLLFPQGKTGQTLAGALAALGIKAEA